VRRRYRSSVLLARPAPIQRQSQNNRPTVSTGRLQFDPSLSAESPGGTSETKMPISTIASPFSGDDPTPACLRDEHGIFVGAPESGREYSLIAAANI